MAGRTKFTKWNDTSFPDLRDEQQAWQSPRMRKFTLAVIQIESGHTETCCGRSRETTRLKDLYDSIATNGYNPNPKKQIVVTGTRDRGIRVIEGARRAAILRSLDRPVPYLFRTFKEV